MNQDNLRAWIHELRTTDKDQGTGSLRSSNDQYCCLGIGAELCGLTPNKHTSMGAYRYGVMNVIGLAPGEFLAWLGLPPHHHGDGDVFLDWGDELGSFTTQEYLPGQLRMLTLAELNDEGFTFHQIADLLDYFGIVT